MDTATKIFIACVSVLPSAVAAFCFWLLKRKIQKKDEKREAERQARQKELDERDKQRREYELCQLNMSLASMALAEATASAVERIPDAHCNGDMHRAMEYARKVKDDQKDFLKERAIQNMEF